MLSGAVPPPGGASCCLAPPCPVQVLPGTDGETSTQGLDNLGAVGCPQTSSLPLGAAA